MSPPLRAGRPVPEVAAPGWLLSISEIDDQWRQAGQWRDCAWEYLGQLREGPTRREISAQVWSGRIISVLARAPNGNVGWYLKRGRGNPNHPDRCPNWIVWRPSSLFTH